MTTKQSRLNWPASQGDLIQSSFCTTRRHVLRFQGGTLQKESFLEGCTRRILSEKDVEAQSTTLPFDDRCCWSPIICSTDIANLL